MLILDELGFQGLDRREAHLLFKVIADRYENGLDNHHLQHPMRGCQTRGSSLGQTEPATIGQREHQLDYSYNRSNAHCFPIE